MDYKIQGGYHINHDNLMILDKEDRQHMIFYFIASQVGEKLEPSDREAFYQARQPYDSRKSFWTTMYPIGYFLAAMKTFKPVQSKLLASALTPFVYYIGKQLTNTNYEREFLANDKTVRDLSKKYAFTVFDFAQAKKEAHLKQLKNSLLQSDYNLFNC